MNKEIARKLIHYYQCKPLGLKLNNVEEIINSFLEEQQSLETPVDENSRYDYAGNKLKEGDQVLFVSSHYTELLTGFIKSLKGKTGTSVFYISKAGKKERQIRSYCQMVKYCDSKIAITTKDLDK